MIFLLKIVLGIILVDAMLVHTEIHSNLCRIHVYRAVCILVR